MGAAARRQTAGQVDGHHTRAGNIIGAAQQLLCQLAAALADSHGAQCAAGHFQDAQGVVIHADELAVVVTLIQGDYLGGGLDDLLPQQVLDQVHLVDAHVGQGAHGRLVLVKEPRPLQGPALGAGVAQNGAEGDHIADDAAVQHLLGLAVHRVKTHVVAHHQVSAIALSGGHHGLALRQRYRHGLLHQHVLAGVQRSRADLRMAAVFHAYGHGVHVGIIHQLIEAVVHLAAVLRRHLLRALHVLVVECDDLRIGVGCILRQMAHLCDLAAADNADSDHKKRTSSVRPQTAGRPALRRMFLPLLYQKKTGKKSLFCQLCKIFHKICAAMVRAQPFCAV